MKDQFDQIFAKKIDTRFIIKFGIGCVLVVMAPVYLISVLIGFSGVGTFELDYRMAYKYGVFQIERQLSPTDFSQRKKLCNSNDFNETGPTKPREGIYCIAVLSGDDSVCILYTLLMMPNCVVMDVPETLQQSVWIRQNLKLIATNPCKYFEPIKFDMSIVRFRDRLTCKNGNGGRTFPVIIRFVAIGENISERADKPVERIVYHPTWLPFVGDEG